MTVRTQYEADLTALKAALVEMGQQLRRRGGGRAGSPLHR